MSTMSTQWTFHTRRSNRGHVRLCCAARPDPEYPGRTEEVAAPTRDELEAALEVHARLDALRAVYGAEWVVGADGVMPQGRIRWVWAAPRRPGRPAPRPFSAVDELEAFLKAAADGDPARLQAL
ncbi:hypothetical protein [Nocardiopsis halophila]|uniref:hypothetical protein n=1 Tax=Nocardiopsis halophila TaxID=141692 RepID=UPI000349EF8C|nr:hypothetical protein [Nocardiopsis halophila]